MSYVIRPVRLEDREAISVHAANSAASLSLPRIPHLLEQKIQNSIYNFSEDVRFPANEFYFFTLEELSTGECVGVSGINSKTGVHEPMFFYKMEGIPTDKSIREMESVLEILRPVKEINGPSEVCALFLDSKHRKEGLGKLLSFSRFLFMADFPKRFDSHVFANMIGFIEEGDVCPFWDSLGRRFFHVDFPTLMARLHYNRSFINSLIPPLPIYVSLLPPAVQKLIGQTHPSTAPALHILLNEGFAFTKKIDPFDGGPVVASKITEIKTVKQSKVGNIGEIYDKPRNVERHLISNRRINYRCTFGELNVDKNGKISILKETAEALDVKENDSIRFVPLPLKGSSKAS